LKLELRGILQSRYSVKAPDIEETLQAMMDYAYSKEGKSADRIQVYSIAGLILEGWSPSEIIEYLQISRSNFYLHINPDIKERQTKYCKEYYQRPEVKEKARNYQRKHGKMPEVKKKKKDYYQKSEVKEKRMNYQREYLQRPKVKERQKEYLADCPVACLWREEDISDDSDFSRFLTYEELLQRKKAIGLKGRLKEALQNWMLTGVIEESEDLGVKKYAINFSSPFFNYLDY
jgi:hypothetical protein